MNKDAEYWGVEVEKKEFGFFEKTVNEWLFIPKKFFIDILKLKEKYDREKQHITTTSLSRGRENDCDHNYKQDRLI